METITPHHTDTVVFTDIGRDSDDTFALIVGRRLRELYGAIVDKISTSLLIAPVRLHYIYNSETSV